MEPVRRGVDRRKSLSGKMLSPQHSRTPRAVARPHIQVRLHGVFAARNLSQTLFASFDRPGSRSGLEKRIDAHNGGVFVEIAPIGTGGFTRARGGSITADSAA